MFLILTTGTAMSLNSVKKRIKAAFGRLIYLSGVHRRILGNRCLIVAFHRVCDEALASEINCSSAEFTGYCRFLRRHFDAITLDEAIRRLKAGESIGGAVVVTFDDGYLDNAQVAAPILRKFDLAATFFIATSFIGSRTQTAWDAADGVQSHWMTWDDVAALHRQGFEFGGHTENHIDLGAIDIHTAELEIENSSRILDEKLGKRTRHFAYPFGGEANIRPDTLNLVKRAGFDCCLSCYGGLVGQNSDLYSLPREPITTYHISPYHFGFELLFR